MIQAYRIVSPRWSHGALSGEGARKFGGRWNSPGRPVVYLGESRSLCALEMLVHLPTPGSRAKPYHLIEVKIPDSMISDYPVEALPEQWRASPPTRITMDIGDEWINTGADLALRVPSVLIPEEHNILLNPNHPDFAKIRSALPLDFFFDSRLQLK